MSDPSNTTTATTPFVETPYDQWIVDNVFEDEIESYGRYIKDVRKEALAAGKYDELVEKQLSYNLGKALVRDGLLTQDNEEEVNTKLEALDKPDLLSSVENILGAENPDPTLNAEEISKLAGFSAASKIGGEHDEDEISEVSEIVRKSNEKTYLELWKKGELLAAVYEDEKGNEIFLGGNIPEGMTEAEVLTQSEKFGVRPQHLFNLRHKRERIGHAGDLMRYEVQRRQLAQVEVENLLAAGRPSASGVTSHRGGLVHSKAERARAKMWGLAKEYGDRTTWDWGDRLNYSLSDGFSTFFRGMRIAWNGLTGDEEEEAQLRRVERTAAFRKQYSKEHERTRLSLLRDLGEMTGYGEDVLDDVIHDMTVTYAYHGGDYNLGAKNVKPFLRYSDNEDELGQNVHRTRYSGALVAQELSLFPKKFKQALAQSGATEEERQLAEMQRKMSVQQNFDQTNKLLRGDEDYADDWAAAYISGTQSGLSDTEILEQFAQTQDFSKFGHRFSGVMSSIGEGFTSIAYGVFAAFKSEWGQEGLISIAENNAHARSIASVFGMEMGAGQDFMEAIGPLVGDAIVTAGLAALSGPTGGATAAAGAAYLGAKTTATVSARAIIAASFKGILKTTGKETMQQAAERVFKAGTVKGLTKERALHVIKAYNSQLAKRFSTSAAAFIPAATRSGANTYGVSFRTVEETLTARHKKEDGTWDEGWSEERVKDEAHEAALGSALTAGTITGLLTGGFSFMGKGGLEDAFLRGMSFRQMRQITSNVLGRNVGSETFRDLMKETLKKVTTKHALIEAPKGFLASALHEGIEEGLDEFFNSLVVDVYTDQDTDMFERMTQVWHGFVLGAALGGSGTLISKAAKNIAPDRFLDRGAAARVEQEVFKQYERDVSAKGLTDSLKASGSPTTAAEVERVVRQYKRSERPDILAAPLNETEEEDKALDETSEVLDEETRAQRQKELDEVNAELQRLSPQAVREEINKAEASKAKENLVDPAVAGSDAATSLVGAEEGSGSGSGSGLTDVTASHAAKNINLELKEEYSQLLEEVDRKEALYKSMEKQLMDAPEGRFNNLKRELDMAAREGRALTPEKAAFLRKEALKRFEENVKLQKKSDSKGATKEDSEALDILANGGFAHTLTVEQLEKLGVNTENIDKPSLRTLTRELAKKIRKLFPVISTSRPEGGAAIPKIYGPTGSVYVDASGNGVFDNDPVAMLTLLESNIPIPVSRETIQAGGINNSFRFDIRGGQHFVSDIMVRESGGLVSARTAFNKVGVLEEDYSQISSLAERLNALQETVVISEDTKVRNPFNTKSKIKLSTLLKRVKDLAVLRKIIAGDETLNLNKDFLEATAVATSLDMQVAIYEYADSIATGQEVASSPFKVQQVKRSQGNYFARQQVARKKRATRSLVSILAPDTDIHETNNFDAGANSADTYSPPSLNPVPPVTENKIGAYVGALHEVGAAALESDPDMLAEMKSILNSEAHGGRDVTNNYTPEQVFDEFIHFMARGNNVANQRAVDFQAMLKANRFTNAAQVRKSLKLLALSSPTVEGDPSTDANYLNLVKEELQGLVGEDSEVTANQAKDFFKDIRKAVGGHQQRAVINGRSMRVNEAANREEIESLGLVNGDPESVIEALEKIVKGKNKKQAAIAELLLSNKDYLQSINFVIDSSAAEYSGRFYIDANGTPTVVINPARSGPRGVADTVLHEYIHAFASRILDTPAESRTPAENKAINRIESLLKILRRNANRDNAPQLIRDGLSNVEEFIAVLLTSPEFQSYVRGMTPVQGQRNFIQRIVEAFARLFGEPTPTFMEAMEDSLALTQKVEPETGAGFKNQVASSVNGSQVRRSRLATSIGMGEEVDANAKLDEAAQEYFVWAAQYVPAEINIVRDDTTDVIAEWDGETESIIFNGRRAAAKINQIVAAAGGKPVRREHILALILNEEVAHVASFAQLSQAEIDALIDALSDTDARRIIEQYYPEGERADAIARLENPDTAREEKFVLVEEGLRIHVQKVLKGSETNEQIDFLLENPSLLDTIKKYFTTTLKKLTYHRDLKDVSPEMRIAVNRIVTEVRAMNAGYRLTQNGMHFDTNNPEATMQQLLKQLEMGESSVPDEEGVDEEAPPVPTLQSRWGADVGTVPSEHSVVGGLAKGESVGSSSPLPPEILADAKDPDKTVNVTLSHTNITLGRRSRESKSDLEKYPLGVMPFSLEIGGAKYNAFNVRMKNAGEPNLDQKIHEKFLKGGSANNYTLTQPMTVADALNQINITAERTGALAAINLTDIKLTNPELKNKRPNSLLPVGTELFAQGPKDVIGGPTGELVSANEDIDVSDMKEGWDALAYNPALGNYMYRVAEDSLGRTRYHTQSKFVGADEMVMVSNLDTDGTNPFENFAIWVKGARYKSLDPVVDQPSHKKIRELIDGEPTPLRPSLQSRFGSDVDIGLTIESFKTTSYPKELDLPMGSAPPQVKTPADVTKLMTRLKKLTIEGEMGRFWYEDAAAKIIEVTNGDLIEAEKLISLVAIFSQNAGVEPNTLLALRAYDHHGRGLPKEDLKIRFPAQNDKAVGILYDNERWSGRKTNNFYKNLMHFIVDQATPEQLASMQIDTDFLSAIRQPVTIDIWVYRAMGYESGQQAGGKEGGDNVFTFSEKVINRLTHGLNQNLPEGAEPYRAYQVQAMIWTAIKARSEQKAVKDKTKAESVKKGYILPNTGSEIKYTKSYDEKLKRETTKESERKHQLLWTKNALLATDVDFVEASRSFDYFLNSMGMTATWEVLPSVETEVGKRLDAMTFDEKRSFTQQSMQLLIDPETGEDLLAKELGITVVTSRESTGGYVTSHNPRPAVTPNVLSTIYPPRIKVPVLDAEGNAKLNKKGEVITKVEYDNDAIRAYARALQFIFTQDAVPWVRFVKKNKEDVNYRVVAEKPDPTKEAGTIKSTARGGTFVSQEDAQAFAAKLNAKNKDKDIKIYVEGNEQAHGIRITFDEELTESKLQEIEDYLASVNSGLGFTQDGGNQIVVINFKMDYNNMLPLLTDEDFTDKIIEQYEHESKLEEITTEGEYGYHDWSEDQEGEGILTLSPRFRPSVRTWLHDRRKRFQETTPEAPVKPRLQSRWGAGSYIPSELDAEGTDFSEWVEMLELPLMEVGTYKSPSKWWSRALLGSADRNIMRFKEERDAFVSSAKKKVEDLKEKHDQIVADAASNNVEIPPELVSRASGSNRGSQLTDAQTKSVEMQWQKERSAANRETVAKRREELRNLAETNRIANIKKLRDQNHAELLKDRDEALKNLLVISPEMHALILNMRKLTDELSQIGNSLFSGFLNRKEEFKATFDGNGGIYITRRYRMFEDNDFIKHIREDGGKYSKEREEAMLFFAAQYMDYHTKRVMREDGLSETQARASVERDLEIKNSSGITEGKKMMEEFIRSYEKNAVKHELEVYAGADGGRSIIMNEKKFKHGPLRALVNNLNEKKDIPAPLRRLLGEYGDEAGVNNISETIIKVSSIMANQAFFNRVVEHGTKGKTPWLISEKDYNEDQQKLESEQKYTGWVTLKQDEGETDWNPIKGFYAHPDIIKDFRDLIKLNSKDSVTKDVTSDAEYLLHTTTKFLHRATGLSLAAKTLGSVGFYVRNMLGNAMFFGPMQGYYGGIGKMFGEIGGVAGVNSVLRENSMIVRAARGSSAQLSAELAVLETLNVWGDEMEASMLRDLLTGKETSVSVEDKLAGLAKTLGELKEKGAKAKKAYEKTVRLATRLASAMDAYYKIGLYEYELSVLEEAALADGPNGKYRRLLKKNEDGELVPSTSMKRAAAIKVKKVSQSYSQAPPLIKALTRNPAGLVIAPYVRFAAEIPRIMGNTFSLLAEERREGKNNPVIRKRYLKRLWGMMSTMGVTFGLPVMLKMMAEIGEDEDEALRKGMPKYLRSHTFYYLRIGDELYSLDLTYLNPFSVIADPVARSMEQLARGEPLKAAGWIARLAEPYVSEQILAKAAFQVTFNKNEYGQKIMYGEDYVKNLGRAFNHIWENAYEPRSAAKLQDAWKALHGDPTPADNAMDWLFKSPLGMIFGELLPVKPYKVDLGNAMRNYMRQHTLDYKEIGGKFNRLLSERPLTDGDIEDIYDNVYKTKLSLNNEFRKIMRGFNGLGMDWNELSAQALSRGVSKERWGQNFNGWMNRPVISKFLEKKLNATPQGAERVYKIKNYSQKYERYIGLDD